MAQMSDSTPVAPANSDSAPATADAKVSLTSIEAVADQARDFESRTNHLITTAPDGNAEQQAATDEESSEPEPSLPKLPRKRDGAGRHSCEEQPGVRSEIPDSEDLPSSPRRISDEVTGQDGNVQGSVMLMKMMDVDRQPAKATTVMGEKAGDKVDDFRRRTLEDGAVPGAQWARKKSVADSDESSVSPVTEDSNSKTEIAASSVTATGPEASNGKKLATEDDSEKYEDQCGTNEAKSKTEMDEDAEEASETSMEPKDIPLKESLFAQDKDDVTHVSLSAQPGRKNIPSFPILEDPNVSSIETLLQQPEEIEMADSQLSSAGTEEDTRLSAPSQKASYTIELSITSSHDSESGNVTFQQKEEVPSAILAIELSTTSITEARAESKDTEMTDGPCSPVQASAGIKRVFLSQGEESDPADPSSSLSKLEVNRTIPFVKSIASAAAVSFKQSEDTKMSDILSSPPEIKEYGKVAKVSEENTKGAGSQQGPQNKEVLFTELKAMKIASIQARNTALEAEIAAKRAKLEEVRKELKQPAAETVKQHIKLLHDYNDIRDVGQGLVGMIADNRGVRIGEIYGEFGVGLKD